MTSCVRSRRHAHSHSNTTDGRRTEQLHPRAIQDQFETIMHLFTQIVLRCTMAVSKRSTATPKASTKTKETAALKEKHASNGKPSQKSTSTTVQSSITSAKEQIDSKLLKQAIQALVQHDAKTRDENKELFESDVPIQIQIGLLKAPGYAKVKPHRILLPHSIRTSDNELPEVCIIVKDSSKPWIQELIPKFPEHFGCIKKVLTLTSLRTKHQSFQQKRELASKYTHFLVDDRILPMVPAAVGKEFLRKHKLVPINITRKEVLPLAIQRAMDATFLKVSKGTCLTLAVGTTKHELDQLVDNVLAAAAQGVDCVPQKWKNVQSLSVKTPRSMALPFYNRLPEELMDLTKLRPEEVIEAEIKQKKLEAREKKAVVLKKKRKLAEKSPLLRALKKQKSESSSESKDAEKTESDEKTGKEVKPNKKSLAKKEPVESVTSKSAAKKSKTKEIPSDESKPAKKAKKEEPQVSKKPATLQASKKTTASEPLTVSASKDSKQKDKGATKSAENALSAFISSKKYSGSKKGYVFKKGANGLGYYIDKLPVVDKQSMQALLRSTTQGRGGDRKRSTGGGSGKKKVIRGRR